VDPDLIPPKEMLFDGSSTPEQFVLFGEGFCNHVVIPRGQLLPSSAILDVGCGNGGVARPLTRFLSSAGLYEGIDVDARAIAWLQNHYESRPNFRFTCANVSNKLYNPGGRLSSGEYRFPFQDATFDVVLLKSVFTHMLPPDVRTYLREIGRVLKQGGRAIITYFLLNDESRRLNEQGLGAVVLKFALQGDPLSLIAKSEMPEWAVGHDESRIRQYHAGAGLGTLDVSLGNWCGRTSDLGLQDMIVATKE
jgi:SAM-dependent methyltransferase